MDKDMRDAFATLAGALAIITHRQNEQAKALAEIVKLLTPEPDKEGPTLPDLLERLAMMIQQVPEATVRALMDARQKAGP